MSGDERFERSRASEATGPSRHIAVFFEDPALRPILIILVVHAALGGALVILAALRSRSLPALALLAILLTLSLDAVRRARRRRWVTLWVLTLWALSALTAIASSHFGLL